jgi:nicotinate-nucleotide pyrophosphorylase (carboxylating)
MKLPAAWIRTQVAAWLAEDLGTGDLTSEATIAASARAKAAIRAKQDLVLAGLPIAREVFHRIDPRVRFAALAGDGDFVPRGAVVARVSGRTRSLLAGERTALNALQHLSGIATLTRRYVLAVAGTRAKVLDTRKTTPGLRLAEKYAVACGGGTNHRVGLFDAVLIKDNHVRAAGGIVSAIEAAARRVPRRAIEVEVGTLSELREALAAGAGIVLLDNMPLARMRRAVAIAGGRALLEASGNVTLARVRAIAATGVDRISIGALTHSAPAADLHMKLTEGGDE